MTSPFGDQLAGSTVFVTGGHGFIGRRVVERLVHVGATVICPFRHDGEMARDLPGTHVRLDLSDRAATSDVMAEADLVVHLAATSGGIAFQQRAHADVFFTNQTISGSVLAAAASSRVRRIFLASSAVVYRSGGSKPLSETAPLVSLSDTPSGYAWSKVSDEIVAGWYEQAGALETVVGRFTNVYGPHTPGQQPSTVVHDLIRKAAGAPSGGHLDVWGDGSALRSFIYVDDAAAAVLTILAGGESGAAYNIDSGQSTTIAGLAETIRQRVNPSLTLRFDRTQPVGVASRVLAVDALEALDFSAEVTLAAGIDRTAAALEYLNDPRPEPRID